ncbi:hypothetical protein LZC95_14165 [Pendulispora brunnea]|uniref:Uncharacterized protein n=1 Tax=Pendulispora brunnea TaxID=2905690 RepID=A0ABZ2KLY0_9BACT
MTNAHVGSSALVETSPTAPKPKPTAAPSLPIPSKRVSAMTAALTRTYRPPTAVPPMLPTGVPLLQWQDVPTSTLQAFAPGDTAIPISQYVMLTVMRWARGQGYPGAIPTWELGDGAWGVIVFENNVDLTAVTIPISALPSFNSADIAGWAQLVMTWAQEQGYQAGIPTFEFDSTQMIVTALVFGKAYPGISFYDAPNAELFASLGQPRMLCDLTDPAVWANAAMRVAMNQGYGAGWPTWQWTTSRGLIGFSVRGYSTLPQANAASVDKVLRILKETGTTIDNATSTALSIFGGVWSTFSQQPISDPGLEILTDCLFGAFVAAVNMIPVVGGAIASLIGTAVTVAQQAAASSGNGNTPTLLQYESMILAASQATKLYVSQVHDNLLNARKNHDTLEQVWAAPYASPVTGQTMQLGMLALAPNDVANGMTYWTQLETQIIATLTLNLEVAMTSQLYVIERRTYQNAPALKQWWFGSIAEVTAPNGKIAQYIASGSDELSVWFTDFASYPGHARGEYVTATEYWLQAVGNSIIPGYPPAALCYALFSSDGFGNTTGYTGTVPKSSLYSWLMSTNEIGAGNETQAWTYFGSNGNIVEAVVSDNGGAINIVAGSTDAYGRVTLNTSNPYVQEFDVDSGFEQLVIVNGLTYF